MLGRLVCVAPAGMQSSFPLYAGECRIGTRGEHEILLEDPYVSNPHAVIFAEGVGAAASLQITDLRSRNGTFVNGSKITRAPLKDKDIVRLGAVELRVELEASH